MGQLIVVVLVVLVLLLPFVMGKWCAYNTELLASYYMEKQIVLPRWPFMVGAYLTQCALPYGIVTEVWCQILNLK